MVRFGITKYWYLVPACLSHLVAQVCKESDLALDLAVAMLVIFHFCPFLAYLAPIFVSLSVSSLCAIPLLAGEYIANIVTGSMELEMYFISSIRLLCRSYFVGEMMAFIAAVLSLNMWTLLEPWSQERCNVL